MSRVASKLNALKRFAKAVHMPYGSARDARIHSAKLHGFRVGLSYNELINFAVTGTRGER